MGSIVLIEGFNIFPSIHVVGRGLLYRSRPSQTLYVTSRLRAMAGRCVRRWDA